MTTLLSRYKIIKELGEGGFGDTHLAEDTALPGNPYCVVKHLKRNPDPAASAIIQRLFEEEAKVLHNLGKHDQIPSLAAHFQEKGEFYLVQEFVDGHDLNREIIPGKKLSEKQTIELLQEILEILAVVHQKNIIHRDIKPSNIMRRRQDGKIVLIDFGAVKEIGVFTVNSKGQTSLTIGIGTPGYMPSEQANGRPKFASDVYAVGIIGIQAVTGLLPAQLQEDSNTGEIIWRNYARVSDRFAEVLTNMVRDHFSQRYQNATEALQALIPPAKTVVVKPHSKDFPTTKIMVGLGVGVAISFTSGYAINYLLSNQGYINLPPSTVPANSPTHSQKVTSSPSLMDTLRNAKEAQKNSPISSTSQSTTQFITAKADFRNLDQLLSAKKWKEADIETYKVMLKLAGREKKGNLDLHSIQNFSCSDLQKIDKHWVKASNRRFGFSVQKQIWIEVAGNPGLYNSDIYNKFGTRVGWRRKNRWLPYSDLTFNSNAPRGHLPNTPPQFPGVTGFRRMIPLISPCRL
jgi:serine/threonine-protein kinase